MGKGSEKDGFGMEGRFAQRRAIKQLQKISKKLMTSEVKRSTVLCPSLMTEAVKKHEKWVQEDFTARDVLDTTYENNQFFKPFKTGKKLGVSYIQLKNRIRIPA